MAEITAKAVKALRDRTGAGMMECKRALGEADGDADKEARYLDVLLSKKVDGLLLIAASHTRDGIGWLARQGPPTIVVDRELDEPSVSQVIVENRHGGRLAGRHAFGKFELSDPGFDRVRRSERLQRLLRYVRTCNSGGGDCRNGSCCEESLTSWMRCCKSDIEKASSSSVLISLSSFFDE